MANYGVVDQINADNQGQLLILNLKKKILKKRMMRRKIKNKKIRMKLVNLLLMTYKKEYKNYKKELIKIFLKKLIFPISFNLEQKE